MMEMATTAPPIPMPAAAPELRPLDGLEVLVAPGAALPVDETEDEVAEVPRPVAEEVTVEVPEVGEVVADDVELAEPVASARRTLGAGAENVTVVGSPQLGSPFASAPQQFQMLSLEL